MHRRVVLMLGLLLLAMPAIAMAHTTIDAGNWFLNPGDGAIQVIQVVAFNDGDDNGLQGMNLNLVTGDSGPNIGGVIVAPFITALDVTGPGTVFNPSFNPPAITIVPDQVAQASVTTGAGTVPGTGVLAFVTVDISGLALGTYDFLVSGWAPIGFPGSDFAGSTGVTPSLIDGTITIVPEPSSVVMGLFAAAGLAAVVIRRRRRVA